MRLPGGAATGPWPAAFALALLSAVGAARAELSADGLVGPGVRARPAYDGSAAELPQFVPVLRLMGEPWFLRTTQDVLEGGWRTPLVPARVSGLHMGVQLAYEPGRKTFESAFLQRYKLPDVSRGTSAGVQLEWEQRLGIVPVTVLARLRQHTDLARGAQLDVRSNIGVFRSGPFGAAVYFEGIWATARSAGAFYDVSAQQAAVSGLPAFAASGGLLSGIEGLGWRWDLGPDWVAVGGIEARRLAGSVVHSPLVQQATNVYAVLGLAYRF